MVPLFVACGENTQTENPSEKFTEEIKKDIENKIKAKVDLILGHDDGNSYSVQCTSTEEELVVEIDLKDMFEFIAETLIKEIDGFLKHDYPKFIFATQTQETILIYTIK